MDDAFIDKIENNILDFATTKRKEWEENHKLYSVVFELTPHCNLKCVHCYLNSRHEEQELTSKEIKDIIDLLYEKEVLFLTFTGGDIFTRNDIMDMYLYAKKKGFIIELYTNGVLINDAMINVFKKYPPLLIDISLYGADEETYYKVTGNKYAFNRVMDNIKKLTESGLRVSLKTPVLNLYYDQLPKMKEIAERYGLPFRTGFEIFPTVDNDKTVVNYGTSLKDNLRYEFAKYESRRHSSQKESEEIQYVDLLKERPLFRCKLGRSSCVIDYQGRMCPCMSFRHAGTKISRDNFDQVWKSFSKYSSMRASENYKCLRCKAYNYCDICPAKMESVYGNLEHTDEHFCRAAWARYDRYDRGMSSQAVLDKLQ